MTSRSQWGVLLYAVALFAAGAVTGAMVMRSQIEPSPLKLNRSGEIANKLQDRLNTRLHLNPDQAAKTHPVCQKAAEELEATHRDCLERVMGILNGMHSQLAPGLSPEQIDALKLIEAERVDAFQKKYDFQPSDKKPAKSGN